MSSVIAVGCFVCLYTYLSFSMCSANATVHCCATQEHHTYTLVYTAPDKRRDDVVTRTYLGIVAEVGAPLLEHSLQCCMRLFLQRKSHHNESPLGLLGLPFSIPAPAPPNVILLTEMSLEFVVSLLLHRRHHGKTKGPII